MEVLLGLVALAFPILAIVGIVMAVGTRDRLRALEFRLAGIERRAAGLSAPPAAAERQSAEPPPEPDITSSPEAHPPTPEEPSAPRPEEPSTPPSSRDEPAAATSPAAAPPAPPGISLEERFGTQWRSIMLSRRMPMAHAPST